VVFKPHPANPKSMAEFETLAMQAGAWWSRAHVHDLLAHARAVMTINSGVGFEAMLHVKPVVTFGRAEYDCATIAAAPAKIDDAWRGVLAADAPALEARYRRFVDWFLGGYAVDLSIQESASSQLERIADEIAVAARTAHAARFSAAPGHPLQFHEHPRACA
jgi:hypothetical protein